jgi:hypothetical protein
MNTHSTQSAAGPSASGQAKEKAQEAAGQAKGALRSQVDQRATDAGRRVGGLASDVRSVGAQLREQGKDGPAKLADQAADRAERIGTYLSESDADRILGDIEDFGRRQPWAVLAGGLAVGLVASRFLKASAGDRYAQRSGVQLPARAGDVAPTSSGVYADDPVPSGPAVPAPATASVEGSR